MSLYEEHELLSLFSTSVCSFLNVNDISSKATEYLTWLMTLRFMRGSGMLFIELDQGSLKNAGVLVEPSELTTMSSLCALW